MTVAEQLIRRGVQQGAQNTLYLVAKNLLENGLEVPFVAKCTGLSAEIVVSLRNQKNSK